MEAGGAAAPGLPPSPEPIVIDLEPKVAIPRYNMVFKVVPVETFLDGKGRDECEVPELHSMVNRKAAMNVAVVAELDAILVGRA